MDIELEALRRRALASGDELDWQRLSQASARFGLDVWGQALPSSALQKLRGEPFFQGRPVFDLSYSRDGRWLALSGRSRLTVWDVSEQSEIYKLRHMDILHCAFDAQGFLYFWDVNGRSIDLWKIDLSAKDYRLVTSFKEGSRIQFSPQGDCFAVVRARKGVMLFSTETLERVHADCPRRNGRRLQFSADGDVLAWANSQWVHSYRRSTGEFFSQSWGHGMRAWVVSPKGRVLRAAEGVITEFHMTDGQTSLFLEDSHSEENSRLQLVDGGRVLICCGSGTETVTAWDMESRERLWRIFDVKPLRVVSGPQRESLAILSEDTGCLRRHSLETGKALPRRLWHTESVTRLAFALDNRCLVVGDRERQVRALDWRVFRRRFEVFGRFEGMLDDDMGVLISRGPKYYSGTFEGRFEASEETQRLGFAWTKRRGFLTNRAMTLLAGRELTGSAFGVQCFDGWFQGNRLTRIVFETEEGEICLYDCIERRKLWQRSWPLPLAGARFSSCGQFLWALFGHFETRSLVRLDSQSGEWLSSVDLEGFNFKFADNAPGALFALTRTDHFNQHSGFHEPLIELYNAELEKLDEWLGHKTEVTALAFSKDGQLLASGDDAGVVFVWNCKPLLKASGS